MIDTSLQFFQNVFYNLVEEQDETETGLFTEPSNIIFISVMLCY